MYQRLGGCNTSIMVQHCSQHRAPGTVVVWTTVTSFVPTASSAVTPFFWERNVARKVKVFFATIGRELLPLALFLLAHCGARKVLFTGLVVYGGVIAYFILSNGNEQARPSHDAAKPARTICKSTETKLVMPHPVLYASNRSKEYLSDTLCGINCGRGL